jgi:hypothetical protein
VSDWDLENGPFAGRTFPDVCVDVEGTILDPEGQVRSDVLALAQEKASGGPITVWTGGDVQSLSKQLWRAGILYKVVSKQAMRGASVRIAIDDQAEVDFNKAYGVGCEEYVQV